MYTGLTFVSFTASKYTPQVHHRQQPKTIAANKTSRKETKDWIKRTCNQRKHSLGDLPAPPLRVLSSEFSFGPPLGPGIPAPDVARAHPVLQDKRQPHENSSQITLLLEHIFVMGELIVRGRGQEKAAAYIGSRTMGQSAIG